MARLRPLPRTTSVPDPAAAGGTETVALCLRAMDAVLDGDSAAPFLTRRLSTSVSTRGGESGDGGGAGGLVGALARVASRLEAVTGLPASVMGLAGALERRGDPVLAREVMARARALLPRDAVPVLHQARLARKSGDADGARRLYREVRGMPGADDRLSRLAAIGEALVGADPRRDLSLVLREAVRAEDAEGAAVAQEERARIRGRGGDRAGALRDYLLAWARYPDPADRARTLHAAADLLSAGGDLLAARELLLRAVSDGRTSQRDHALARLHALSRALGDDLGRRRWRGERPAPLVSLIPSRITTPDASRADRVARWTRRLQKARPCGGDS